MPRAAWRLVIPAIPLLWVAAGLIYLLSESIFATYDPTQDSSSNSARVALEWIRRLPTDPLFYLLAIGFAGAYFGVRWYLYAHQNDQLVDQESRNLFSRLSTDDWHTIRGLRRRALTSRMHADVTLGGVIVLLFGSIYLVLFILPLVPGTDWDSLQGVRLQERYGEKLKKIGRGEFWLELDESTARTFRRQNITEPAIQARRGRYSVELPEAYRSIVFGLTQVFFSDHERKERTITSIDLGRAQVSMDRGLTWNEPQGLSLRADELVISATFSQDGTHGLITGDKGGIFETKNGGKTWSEVTGTSLENDERVLACALSHDGANGVLAGDKGSVFAKSDGGGTWTKVTDIDLKNDEWMLISAFSHDGSHGVLAGDRGSIFTTSDQGRTWSDMTSTSLLEREWIVYAAVKSKDSSGLMLGNMGTVILNDDGEAWFESSRLPLSTGTRSPERIVTTIFDPTHTYGIVASNRNSVFITDDGGRTWNLTRDSFGLERGGRVFTGTIGVGGQNRIIAGNRSSISFTQDGGRSWSPIDVGTLRQGEWIVNLVAGIEKNSFILTSNRGTVFEIHPLDRIRRILVRSSRQGYSHFDRMVLLSNSRNGMGVFDARNNRAFVAKDAGNTVRRATDITLQENERIDIDLFGDDGRVGLVATTHRTMYSTGDGGRTWRAVNGISLNQNERIATAALSNSDGRGLVEGSEGTLFLTPDGGSSWKRPEVFPLKTGETINSVFFLGDANDSNENDDHSIIIGNDATIVVDKKNDGNWITTGPDRRNVSVVSAFSHNGDIAIQDGRERIHVLRDYPNLSKLRDGDIAGTRRAINGADELLRNSTLGREITAFLAKSSDSEDGTARPRNGESWADKYVGEITLMRIATFTVTFFLVQLLVRIYRYSIRLGAFWDSRADAVLLASTFSRTGAVPFGELVEAVAPDKFDFKPPSRPTAEPTSFIRRRGEN